MAQVKFSKPNPTFTEPVEVIKKRELEANP